MRSPVLLSGLPDADGTGIEGVAQEVAHGGGAQHAAGPVPEASLVEKRLKNPDRVLPGRVETKGLGDQGRHARIECLHTTAAPIDVASRGLQGVETLLQATIEAFPDLFPEIADVVSSNHRLDVRG